MAPPAAVQNMCWDLCNLVGGKGGGGGEGGWGDRWGDTVNAAAEGHSVGFVLLVREPKHHY